MVLMCLKCEQWRHLNWPITKEWVWIKMIAEAAAATLITKGSLSVYNNHLSTPLVWQNWGWVVVIATSGAWIIYDLVYFWPKWLRNNWKGETILISVASNGRLHVHFMADDLEFAAIPIEGKVTLEMNLAHPESAKLHGPHTTQWRTRLIDSQHPAFVDGQNEYQVTLIPSQADMQSPNQFAFNTAVESLTRNLRAVHRHSLVAHCSSSTFSAS